MQPLTRGQKIGLSALTSSKNIRVRLNFTVSSHQEVDFACFPLNARNQLYDAGDFAHRGQPQSLNGSIQMTEKQHNDVYFNISLDRLPSSVRRLVFTVAMESGKTMANLLEGVARIYDDTSELACFAMIGEDFNSERAIITVELYIREGWRLAAVGQGFNAGIMALRAHFGSAQADSILGNVNTPPNESLGVKPGENTTKERKMADLEKLVADIIADGKVDATEVAKLREVLYADGEIDRDEAAALFKINNAVSGNQNDPAWKDFFVKAVTKCILGDPKSPGAVDDDEAAWLVAAVEGDGVLDDAEKALLANIKAKATEISPILKAKLDACGL